MASIETFRPALPGPVPPIDVPAGRVVTVPAAFQVEEQPSRSGDTRLVGLLAFALAADRGEEPDPDTVARLRREAETALCDHAFRYLHNNIEQLRREAVTEHLGHLPKPPGFLRLVAANLVALAVAGAVAGWLALHPATLTGLTGLLAG